ncbi:CBO0543 family protein [uncultured Clostridium sp.]|uniref:CBO0543 family protein n=1 Tax=uncultured Clostridium sp. TaxID=59620 RepID=UPI0026271B26|nr:CBO0543 family protein [uncultured Clostridium sp.]
MVWSTLEAQSHSLYKKLHNVHIEYFNFWKNNILFTWRWWIAVSLVVLPWTIWLLVRKKESTDRLLFVALFVMVFSAGLDMIGIALNLWYYPVNVFPLMPEFIPFDICALPVATMLCIQYFPNVSPYIKAGIYSLISSFMFEPLNELFGLYRRTHWEHYYSIPIMVFIYLIANYLASNDKFARLK